MCNSKSLEIECPVVQGEFEIVEVPITVRAVKYKIIHSESGKTSRNPYYERKLLGWTVPITNIRGTRLAEKRNRAFNNKKSVKVRVI